MKECYPIKRCESEDKSSRVEQAKSLCDLLVSSGIDYEYCISHDEVLGCGDSREYYEKYRDYLGDYTICKNLVIHERKGQHRTFLVITSDDKSVDLKDLRDTLHVSKLEFASGEELRDLLDTYPGNVSLFNLMYDTERKVELVVDDEILGKELLAFHPLYNGMSLFLRPDEAFKFVSLIGRDVLVEHLTGRESGERGKVYQKALAN